MTTLIAPPFQFVKMGHALVDEPNNLKIRMYQWPEYHFSVSIGPLAGPQADAWPLRDKAYFEFDYDGPNERLPGICRFSYATAHQPFDRDYPGRTAELLETIVPLIIPVGLFGADFPDLLPGVEARISELLIPLLLKPGRYSWFDDEPEAETARQARAEQLRQNTYKPRSILQRLIAWQLHRRGQR